MKVIILPTLLFVGQSVAASIDNATWPNSFPKQLATVRRRSGLTTAEYLYHHTLVHGAKAWNAPDTVDQPLAYYQGHVFDSAYGINTTQNVAEPTYFGHNDLTELYSRSAQAFNTTPSNNYTQTVIGPDGAAFNDFNSTLSMYSFENFQPVNNTCTLTASTETFNAFYWVIANASNSNTAAFDNTTFADQIMQTFLDSFPVGTIYNASVHTPVPGLDSRPYYGGGNNPTLNAVLKFWLCDDNDAISAFRRSQSGLIAKNSDLGINLDASFVMFSRPVLIYDRSTATGFDRQRGIQAILADRVRGDIAGPPVEA